MRKRITIGLIVLALLGLILTVVWKLADWPPPGMILRYGLTPGCEPTGETKTLEGVEFVEIGPGCFRMGSHYLCDKGNLLGRACAAVGLSWGRQPKHGAVFIECPVHWVEFRRGFWIAKHEVTNEQYELFDSRHFRHWRSRGDKQPVDRVAWVEAKRYCSWLSKRAGVPIRLPSEAEWECACRAGSTAEFPFGDEPEELPEYAWFLGNSRGRTHDVGTRRPNRWGLHDLLGNVDEWCEDTHFAEGYAGAP